MVNFLFVVTIRSMLGWRRTKNARRKIDYLGRNLWKFECASRAERRESGGGRTVAGKITTPNERREKQLCK